VTRLAVLADVHANLPALEAVIDEIRRQRVDGIIAAGDYLSSGPHPVEVVRLLRGLGAHMVRGNAEGYFLAFDGGDAPDPWYTSHQWAALRWSYRQLDEETLEFLGRLPDQRVLDIDGAAPIRVVHGSPRSPSERLFPEGDETALSWFREAGLLPADHTPPRLKETLATVVEPVLACGHTHIPWVEEHGHQLAFNPGSVSLAFNGDARAHFALLTWKGDRWCVEHRAIEYDLGRVRQAFHQSGFLAEGGPFARAALLNVESARNALGYLYWHIDGLAADAGLGEWDSVPDALWDRAIASFSWDAYAGKSQS
jgi:predicted phosphodiesterase